MQRIKTVVQAASKHNVGSVVAGGDFSGQQAGGTVDVGTQQRWDRVRDRLRQEVGDEAFRSWLNPLTLDGVEAGRVRMALPTRFMRDWVATHYADRLNRLWQAECGAASEVELIVSPRSSAAAVRAAQMAGPQANAHATTPATAKAASAAKAAAPNGTLLTAAAQGIAPVAPPVLASEPGDGSALSPELLSAPLDPRFTFENFIVGKPNELAFAAARRVAEQTAVSFNPLFLYGGVGLGKTHLMHAIAWEIRRRDPARKVIYLSAEKFMYQFIRALRFKDTVAFKDLFRSVDVLMIDDVQFISGKDSTQEEFFHTFNAPVDQNRQVIVSADKSPSDLEGLEERLRSRLGWGLVADIHPTTYELRLGILQAKAEQLGVKLPEKVMEFLAHKIASNVRELEGALNRLVAHATLVGRSITLDTTQEVLHDLLRANDRRVTIDEIQKRVAEYYNIRLADMSSARRARQVARPRQVAMYLAKVLTSRSLPEIGRRFGGRDHTTVMHAVRKVEELMATDASISEDVELLRRMLEA